jgi:hypothetical protein
MRTLWAAVLFPFLLTAQDRDAERGRKIIDQAIQALGGPVYLTLRDYKTEGRAFSFDRWEEINGLSPIVNYERLPDKFRQVIGKKRDVIYVLNGDQGWDSNFRGVALMATAEVERIKLSRSLSFDVVLRFRLKEAGISVLALGTDFVEGRPVDIVEVADNENRVVRMGFDQQTHLPVRREWERTLPNRQREQWVETLGKYHAAKNSPVQFPFYIRREKNGIKVYEGFVTEVEVNSRHSDSLFQRPEGKERIDVPSRRSGKQD